MLVEHLEGIRLVLVVVLAEHQVLKVVVFVDERQRVELVVPDDVVCKLERSVLRRHDELLARCHDLRHLCIERHAGQAVIALGHDSQQLAMRLGTFGHGHRRMAGPLEQLDHLGQRHIGRQVGVGHHETRLVIFDAGDHGRLIFDRLRAVDEGHAAFGGKGDGHLVIRHRLHDCGHHGDVQADSRLLFATAIFNERRLQADVLGNGLFGRVPWNKQVLVECAGRFLEIVSHRRLPFCVALIVNIIRALAKEASQNQPY